MTRYSCTPRVGPFAGRKVFTNRAGNGVFTETLDGGERQHVGTAQTPGFNSNRTFAAWIYRRYSDEYAYRQYRRTASPR